VKTDCSFEGRVLFEDIACISINVYRRKRTLDGLSTVADVSTKFTQRTGVRVVSDERISYAGMHREDGIPKTVVTTWIVERKGVT
jgi:hypothetical protein